MFLVENRNLDAPDIDYRVTNPISSISSDMLSDPNDSSSVLPRVSRHGRVIKAPEKLDLFNQALYVFESKCDVDSKRGRMLKATATNYLYDAMLGWSQRRRDFCGLDYFIITLPFLYVNCKINGEILC
ncbi:hypothetical protein TNIN_196051 [Trichonephila inaurata madagascariensis]|uniref:Uncharacterized protein n=1 Tax=Trichonephila inaurata madagascariensis TaxID=2747483 RepID=A0A8X6WTE4_9ARAC|nr:hypothetical protein TNIN_357391 [Trichonephila inaurata madagascariensis]GFY40420.1 hypothetical protein TNIN_196051 [Trichonephila inaurata madagascariensis]